MTDLGKRKKEKSSIIEKIHMIIDDSPEMILGGMTIELIAGKQATIEGIKAIIDYDDSIIVVRDQKNLVRIMGGSLYMPYFTDHSAIIKGDIQSVEYMNGGVGNGK